MMAASWRATEAPPRRERVAKITPLPLSQMIPMTIVIVNESICGTMLMPFIAPFVAFLRGVPVEKAGYFSGILVGVFMLGQVVSSRTWGFISDKYGRRFPIISGLFTSGLMMLGFGLSTSVWMCAFFRFLHGLFNGNVLVAKTMMADITDKTNQAKGFAFVSLCYGIGILIGPVVGGLLYDPAHSSSLRWTHVSEDSVFGRHPAFLPSFVIFVYTNIGMLICTFFVMESNPKAQPLPRILAYIYPCFWREPERFVHPPTAEQEEQQRESMGGAARKTISSHSGSGRDDEEGDDSDDVLGASIRTTERLVANVALTCAVPSVEIASPVRREGRRFDHHIAAENLTVATRRTAAVTPRYGLCTLAALTEGNDKGAATPSRAAVEGSTSGPESKASTSREGDRPALDDDGTVMVVDAVDGAEVKRDTAVVGEADQGEEEEHVLKSFGYRDAFACPPTRMMLVLYMLISAADMTVQEILSLWAIAGTSVGGLGFFPDQVSYILLTNSVPCVVANLFFHKVCTHYENKLSLFRLAVAFCAGAVTILPFISYLNLGSFVFPTVVVCTGFRQFFASWSYGIVTMLTARAAPVGHVGAIMGINQSCGALTRTLVPFLVTPLFAWSITSHHPFPFNHVLVFLLSSIVFMVGYVYSIWLRTDADAHLEVVEEGPAWMQKLKSVVVGGYHATSAAAQRAFASCWSH